MEKLVTIIIISGKRYSGKSFIGTYIMNKLKKFNINIEFLHAANILKYEFCEKYQINYNKLLSDRSYKEKYRIKMTHFYNQTKKSKSIDYYNEKLLEHINKTTKPTIYILDVRHKFEIDFYEKYNFTIIKIRINTDDKIKKSRGWKYDKIIDEDITETDLDNYVDWDFVLNNNQNGTNHIDRFIESLLKIINSKIDYML